MLRRVLPMLVLAGCTSEGLLEVRVLPPTNGTRVDEVELYVGVSGEHSGMVRPAAGLLAPTVWWKRDPAQHIDIQPMTPDGVTYQFIPGGWDDAVSALVAVGWSTDASTGKVPQAVAVQLAWLDIPGDEVHRYTLTLGDVDRLPRDQSDRPGVPGLQVWGPPENPRACVQIDDVPELAELDNAQSAMIVTKDDQDCDGYFSYDETLECFEDEYMGAMRMSRDTLSCLIPKTDQATARQSCIVGGRTCADGVPSDGCAPSNYCIATDLCLSGCTDLDCMLTTGAPFILCMLPATNTPPREFCPGANAVVDLPGLLGIPMSCDPLLGTKLRTTDQPFTTSLTYTSGSGGMALTLATIDDDKCMYALYAEGDLQRTSLDATIINYRTAIAAPLLSPVKERGVAMPLVVRAMDTQCTNPDGGCSVIVPGAGGALVDPGLAACVNSTPAPSTIVID